MFCATLGEMVPLDGGSGEAGGIMKSRYFVFLAVLALVVLCSAKSMARDSSRFFVFERLGGKVDQNASSDSTPTSPDSATDEPGSSGPTSSCDDVSGAGCTDTDKDGIADFLDACPCAYGKAVFKPADPDNTTPIPDITLNGCPDVNGDGVLGVCDPIIAKDFCQVTGSVKGDAGWVDQVFCISSGVTGPTYDSQDSQKHDQEKAADLNEAREKVPEQIDEQKHEARADAHEKVSILMDRDGDGIPQFLDACPNCPGDRSDDPTINGCPLKSDGTVDSQKLMICKLIASK